MTVFTMHRDRIFRMHQRIDQLDLLLAGMAGNMNAVAFFVNNVGAEFIKVINCARYEFFVAGNRRCRNNNGIARKNFNLFMVIIGHTG